MRAITIHRNFESWRAAARGLLAEGLEPSAVMWRESEDAQPLLPEETGAALITQGDVPTKAPAVTFMVPDAFVRLANLAACYRDTDRWGLLYRVLWRLTHGERELLEISTDDDVHRLLMMEKAVRRDRHKMTAFVRFRRIEREPVEADGDWYIAWHRPDHYIVRLTAPFFARRFASMNWSILTPDESVTWDGSRLTYSPGVPASAAPQADELEGLWKTYYASIFNPGRIKLSAMKRELPVRHWPTLPETQIIDELLREAPQRVEEMIKRTARTAARAKERSQGDDPPEAACVTAGSAAEFVPASRALPVLRKAAETCRGCDIYCHATQTVFGEGPADATVMFVGEQPGDQEDLAGKPFVGPAGKLLDEAFKEAGVPREEAYVTNAVKHFKFEPRGTRRIHSKPSAREVAACRPWLEAEISAIKPQMIVCLGATAAQALLGREFRVTRQRGQVIRSEWSPWTMATIHPSALLRIPDEELRRQSRKEFIDDLKKVAKQIRALKSIV